MAGAANLEVASVWMRRGQWAGTSLLDEKEVVSVTSLLTPSGLITGTPHRLKCNSNLAFEGSRIEGTGFVLSPDVSESLVTANPRNAEVLCRFLRGEDFLNRPDQSPAYFVINFRTWPLNRDSASSGYPARSLRIPRMPRHRRAGRKAPEIGVAADDCD